MRAARDIAGGLPAVGHRFSSPLRLSVEEIITGADFAGDMNPLHHDESHSHTQEFGTVIASGSHVTGMFTAMIPTEFVRYGPMIGAQMSVKFLRPVLPLKTYCMTWTVKHYEWKSKLNGYLYELQGKIELSEKETTGLIVKASADIVFYGAHSNSP